MVPSEKRVRVNKYQEAYEDLRHRYPIDSMDETTTEYPSRDFCQIDQMLEERRNTREQTPKRDLNPREYQPRKIIPPNKIELNLPKSSWTLHRDTALHDMYPIPEDEGERRSEPRQSSSHGKESTNRWERVTETSKGSNPLPD